MKEEKRESVKREKFTSRKYIRSIISYGIKRWKNASDKKYTTNERTREGTGHGKQERKKRDNGKWKIQNVRGETEENTEMKLSVCFFINLPAERSGIYDAATRL